MMFRKIKISSFAKILIFGVVIFVLISFEQRKYSSERCTNVIVKINNQYDNYFIDESDVKSIINDRGTDPLIGKSFSQINLKYLERIIKQNPYIQHAEIYKDLSGNILANVHLRRPVARVVSERYQDRYIADDGVFLPISQKFTARVVLVSGINTNLKSSIEQINPQVLEMIQFINQDKFWKAQIAQIDVQKNGEMILYPQVTKQYIEFGTTENINKKFKNLKLFYKKILPQKGWNKYSKINIKYNNQIIAE